MKGNIVVRVFTRTFQLFLAGRVDSFVCIHQKRMDARYDEYKMK